jgi:hypothetical protein
MPYAEQGQPPHLEYLPRVHHSEIPGIFQPRGLFALNMHHYMRAARRSALKATRVCVETRV